MLRWYPSKYVPGERYALGWRWHVRLCIKCKLTKYAWAEPVLMTARQLTTGKWQVWSERVQLKPGVVMPPKEEGKPEIKCSCPGKLGPRRKGAVSVRLRPAGRPTIIPIG